MREWTKHSKCQGHNFSVSIRSNQPIQCNYDQPMETLPSPTPEKAMHIITNDYKTLNTSPSEKDQVSSQTATTISILEPHRLNPEVNTEGNLDDEKDVVMRYVLRFLDT